MARDLSHATSALTQHLQQTRDVTTQQLFAGDPRRFENFHAAIDGLVFDYSKQRVSAETMTLLYDLAVAAKLDERRAALFAGEKVNVTENRSVLHMALRNMVPGKAMMSDGTDVMPDVREVRERMGAYADGVRGGTIKAANGERFTDVVNIGIGGSDLGPAMVARALSPFVADHLTLHFVSNVDGADLGDTLKLVPLATTLFIVCSKTFTTLETMTNARSARRAVADALGEAAVADHFCAVSTQLDKIAEFGIKEDRVFGFWDWVGGRYSVWSAIGLSVEIGIGKAAFEQFLSGGQDIDEHFFSAPSEKNIPVLMALVEIWNHNFLDLSTQAVIPYDQRLGRFPAYLQQLEMESNGKHVQLDGTPVMMKTSPIIFGEPGTNGQHAFFQMLHQGTEPVPIDFLVAAVPTDADGHHHDLLVANCFAQGEALMRGARGGRGGGGAGERRDGQGRRRQARSGQAVLGQSPDLHLSLHQPDAAHARSPYRALRAQGVHSGRYLGHRQLRPVGRRAWQGTRRALGADRVGQERRDRRARFFYGRIDPGSAAAGCCLEVSLPIHARLEFGQEHDALLLVGVGAGDNGDHRLGGAAVVGQVRHVGGDVAEVAGTDDCVVLQPVAPEATGHALQHVDRSFVRLVLVGMRPLTRRHLKQLHMQRFSAGVLSRDRRTIDMPLLAAKARALSDNLKIAPWCRLAHC